MSKTSDMAGGQNRTKVYIICWILKLHYRYNMHLKEYSRISSGWHNSTIGQLYMFIPLNTLMLIDSDSDIKHTHTRWESAVLNQLYKSGSVLCMFWAHGSGITHVVNTHTHTQRNAVWRFTGEHCVLWGDSAVIHMLYICPQELMFPVQFKHKLYIPGPNARALLSITFLCSIPSVFHFLEDELNLVPSSFLTLEQHLWKQNMRRRAKQNETY